MLLDEMEQINDEELTMHVAFLKDSIMFFSIGVAVLFFYAFLSKWLL